ncbi:MAG: hypothetical protein HYW77_03095 [Parcubacteria group bacterium]|nr:hypothetical protein [Parcubacteria group bacterium]
MEFSILDSYLISLKLLASFWWTWLPVVLVLGTRLAYGTYLKEKYEAALEWVTLEIRIPPEIRKSPKASEQMFSGFHGLWLPEAWKDKWVRGKFHQDYLALETVAKGGGINFYIRTPSRYRNIVESHVYAQYSDAEISEVTDFINDLPKDLPNEEYDLWGGELVLTKEDAYPIRTHPEFEESGGIGEEKRIDPLAALAEALGSLKPGENVWLQYLIRPTTDDKWIKEGKTIVDKIMGRTKPLERDAFGKTVDFIDSLIPGNMVDAPKEKAELKSMLHLSHGEQEIIKAIDRNTAKIGFDSGIRLVYIARRDVFNLGFLGALIGAFKQFASSNLNGFRLNPKAFTSDKGFFAKVPFTGKGLFSQSLFYKRKVNLFNKFIKRQWVKKAFVFNTEELATIYHLPTISVRAPSVPRIEAKKGMPPITLPTE